MEMEIFDRADGVKGHFCIGRAVKIGYDGAFWEYYNKGKWSSAGEVFPDRLSAEYTLERLRGNEEIVKKATGV